MRISKARAGHRTGKACRSASRTKLVLPCQTVYVRRGVPLQLLEREPKEIDAQAIAVGFAFEREAPAT
jgi:hypothetical protein